MGEYRKGGGYRGNSRGGDRERTQMHKATCSDCGKSCEVPFRPTGEKPVFCNSCFGGKSGGDSRGSRDRGDRGDRKFDRSDSKPRYDDKKSFKKDSGGSGDIEGVKYHLKQMNETLNKILVVLSEDSEVAIPPEDRKPARPKKAPKKEVDKVALKKTIKKAVKKVAKKKAKKVVKKKTAKKKAKK